MNNSRKFFLVILFALILVLNVSCDLFSHFCEYNKMVASEEYLVSNAICTERSKYAYSCGCGKAGTETFEYGSVLGHDCSGKIILDNYKVHDATCTEEAEYFYSCVRCGTKSFKTFKYGTCKDHNFNQKITNDKTRLPNQIHSCLNPLRYYYSCECGAISTAEVFETTALSDHFWIEEQDSKFHFKENQYYKHCMFCDAISEETFLAEQEDNNQEQIELLSDVYEKGMSETFSVEAEKTYLLKVMLYTEDFVYHITFSSDESALTLNLYEEQECINVIDAGLYEELDGLYYFSIISTQPGELTVSFDS